MKTVSLETYNPGKSIIKQGEHGEDFFIVYSSDQLSDISHVEVVINKENQGEVFLTKLGRGSVFGQKYFTLRRSVSFKFKIIKKKLKILFIFFLF